MIPQAPIDPVLLDAVIAPLGDALTLPRDAYLSEQVLAWEKEWLFAANWVCLGRAADLLGPGQARAVDAAGEGILLIDDGSGIKAFSNVCRHRGHELMAVGDARDVRLIRCPYHSWTYYLDGSLRSAPVVTQTPSFEPAEYPLISLRTAEWLGWLFVNLSGRAPDIDQYLGDLIDHLSPYRPQDLAVAASHSYEVRANWKVVVENYHECYHCSTIHPALCKVSPPESGSDFEPTGMWCGGSMELRDDVDTMSFDGRSKGIIFPELSEQRRRQVLYIGIFPNLLVSTHPDYVMTHRLIPLGVDRTFVECSWLFAPETIASPFFDPSYAVDFWDLTNRQDWSACEGVQRGVANRGYRQGPLSSWEGTLHQFNEMVARAYRGEGLKVPIRPRVSKRASDLLVT
jgi:Rieske 2Fe-2S family protein